MKNIAVIGSSGSIGRQTLNVIRRYPDKFRVTALVVNKSIDILNEQIKEFKPEYVGITDEFAYKNFSSDCNVKIVGGNEALTFACVLSQVDVVVIAVSCMDGLPPVISAIENNKIIALANKESIVCGGEYILPKLNNSKAKILPVDSEHSAVWQILGNENYHNLKRIILTASGGAYYGKNRNFLDTITPEQAVKHPNWSMGKKISVDSATMVNKGLEIIEAARLFNTKNIDYIIHPQSIVHSMVEYNDGVVMAQMGVANMETPIQYALTYPERFDTGLQPLLFDKPLTFLQPDEDVFPAPKLAKQCLEAGGIMPCVFSAADEIAVKLFLENRIKFTQIVDIIDQTLQTTKNLLKPDIQEIYDTYNSVIKQIRKDYID